jgi:hypothetical protein
MRSIKRIKKFRPFGLAVEAVVFKLKAVEVTAKAVVCVANGTNGNLFLA